MEDIQDETNKIISSEESCTDNVSNSSWKEVGTAIELRSEEVHEILSRPPHALVRYGISVVCGVLLLLFAGSFFFKYPDIVNGDVIITTENPPVWLVAKSTGKIKELLCADKQQVNKGELLAVIENPAVTKDVLTVNQLLSEMVIADSSIHFSSELLTTAFELGSIQSGFSVFTRALANYRNFISFNLTQQEKDMLNKQIYNRRFYTANLHKQMEMKKKELKIAKSDYEREKVLYREKVISAYDMENAEQKYLSIQQSLQQLETSISMVNVESSQLTGSLGKMTVQYMLEQNQLLAELKATRYELQTTIESWQQNYLFVAPVQGVVSFNAVWTKNQNINTGDKVFAVVSKTPGRLLGKIQVPASGAGKIHVGQQVNIKVAGYPYLEYGLLQGSISQLSMVANDAFYTAEIAIDKGLMTTVGKKLNFTGELTGAAEIITENRSLMERIYAPLQYLMLRSFK